MESNFFRFLLFFGHGTMQVNQSVFSLIPNLDYSRHWSDKDLFEKFKLSPDEIRNIQNIIAPNTGL
jgi:site-specific DNA-methyltransferase (adenine-specific)